VQVRRWLTIDAQRAAIWALRARRAARRRIGARELPPSVPLPLPPALPGSATPLVETVMRRTNASCLERSLVLQAWHAARGERRDLIIGVSAPNEEFGAHAWLEDDPPTESRGLAELTRWPPPEPPAPAR
jgi:Transglutaminase-like superfamily